MMGARSNSEMNTPNRRPSLRATLRFAVLWACVLPVALSVSACRKPEPEAPSALLPIRIGGLGAHDAVNRSGDVVNTSVLRGRYAVVDFIFTNCGGTCPPMSRAMQRLQEAVKDQDDVVLTSFTVDPRRDTPEVLKTYAERYEADADKWLFLRMPEGFVKQVTNEELKIGGGDRLILHSQKFALLDREGRVAAFYSPLDDDGWLETLLADLDRLREQETDG